MLGQSQTGKNFLISLLSTLKVSNSEMVATTADKTIMKEKKANHNLLSKGMAYLLRALA